MIIHKSRPSHCPNSQINNRKPTLIWQRTMPWNKHSMDIVIPIGIHCYFDFDSVWKVAKFSICQTQSAINAIQYVRNLPLERPFAKRFSQDIFPPSVGFGCKGTTKFADVQILSGKSDYDKYLNKNTGLMDKEEIEHSTRSRYNRRIFIYSAGYRRALDR